LDAVHSLSGTELPRDALEALDLPGRGLVGTRPACDARTRARGVRNPTWRGESDEWSWM